MGRAFLVTEKDEARAAANFAKKWRSQAVKDWPRAPANGATLDGLLRLREERRLGPLSLRLRLPRDNDQLAHIYREHGYLKLGNTYGGGFAIEVDGGGPLDTHPVVFLPSEFDYIQRATRSLADFLSLVAYDPDFSHVHRTRGEWSKGREAFIASLRGEGQKAAIAGLLGLPQVRAVEDPAELVESGGFFRTPDEGDAHLYLAAWQALEARKLEPAVFLDAVEIVNGEKGVIRLGVDLPGPSKEVVEGRPFRELIADIRRRLLLRVGDAPVRFQVVFRPQRR